MKNRMRQTDIIIMFFFGALALFVLIPIWYVFVVSVSTPESYARDDLHMIPYVLDFTQYKTALSNKQVFLSFITSVKVTLGGTALSMLVSTMGGYALSKKYLPGRKIIFRFIVVTMFFSGGMVPFYLVVKGLGITDTIWALILPLLVSSFNLILMKNHFVSIPVSLEESAKLDGCNDFQILFRIVLPVSKAVIATITLFYMVTYWNDYYQATLFINTNKKYPFQVVIRQMVIEQMVMGGSGLSGQTVEQFKMACVMIGILPMMLLYPFVQKFFNKGVMVGAIKE